MTMLEGTALAFLKIGAVAACFMVVIVLGCRYLEKRGRDKLASQDDP